MTTNRIAAFCAVLFSLLLPAAASAQSADRWPTLLGCRMAVMNEAAGVYAPSDFHRVRPLQAGEEKVSLEERACVEMLIVGGYRWIFLPKGSEVVMKDGKPVADGRCFNPIRQIVYYPPPAPPTPKLYKVCGIKQSFEPDGVTKIARVTTFKFVMGDQVAYNDAAGNFCFEQPVPDGDYEVGEVLSEDDAKVWVQGTPVLTAHVSGQDALLHFTNRKYAPPAPVFNPPPTPAPVPEPVRLKCSLPVPDQAGFHGSVIGGLAARVAWNLDGVRIKTVEGPVASSVAEPALFPYGDHSVEFQILDEQNRVVDACRQGYEIGEPEEPKVGRGRRPWPFFLPILNCGWAYTHWHDQGFWQITEKVAICPAEGFLAWKYFPWELGRKLIKPPSPAAGSGISR